VPRDLPIGNGSILINFDAQYRLADFFFPHVGMENHAAARFRFGVFADDRMCWIEDPQWQKSLNYLRDTLVTDVTCESEALGIKLRCHDGVDADSNVYLRKIVVRNARSEKRTVKIVLHHDLNLYASAIGDTAMYDPAFRGLIHYKARRYFLINAQHGDEAGIDEYECGRSGVGGTEGTWRDAEDGKLSLTAIAQGTVDSTIAMTVDLEPNGSSTVLYWICAGRRYREVREMDKRVRAEGASRVLARTAAYWYTWANKSSEILEGLADEVEDLYKRSLLVVRTQADNGGAVLAANDSDIQWGHNDHYSYTWARDAAIVCDAMDRAGYPELTRRFLSFAYDVIHDEGYMLHKYNPDGSFAPLWNPWIRDGKPQLPIQEDETALVLWLVWRHYERTRDIELVRAVYDRLVVKPSDFLLRFRDAETGLPLPSYDMWEERLGVFTFTCAAVSAGLSAAAKLAHLFNDQERRESCEKAAEEVRDAMLRHLWIEEEARLARGLVVVDGGGMELDRTVDASTFGVFYFDVLPPTSAVVTGTMQAMRDRLSVKTEVGGIARYEADSYHRISADTDLVPGNPWLMCTLWLAEHIIAGATTAAELQPALDIVRWARSKAPSSLVLPEQIDPFNGSALSVAPLTWSHAQVVSVVRGYVDRLRKLRTSSVDSIAMDEAKNVAPNPVDNHGSIT
jgi:glucoamylase